jgi:asparagine synthase (glutamine-hydrolysing)
VRLRLVSDVEVGAFLSGGVDSAAVVAWMSRHVAHPVRTFTARFSEKSYDEGPAAEVTARALGSRHVDACIGPDDLDALPDIVWHSEELTADSSMLAIYRLARRAREDVKVVMTGEGADEVFGGYPTYLATRLSRWYARLPRVVRDGVLRPAVARLPVSSRKASLESRLRRFVNADVSDVARAHASWRVIFDERQKARLRPGAGPFRETAALYEPWLDGAGNGDLVNRLLEADLSFYLPNDMLVKADRMTMAWGVEARTPYLDYRVVELAAQLPSRIKCRSGLRKKALLRRVATRVLPAAFTPRPKAGFSVPIARWLRAERRDFVTAHLLDVRADLLSVLSRPEIERIVAEHFAGTADHSHQLWGLLCFSLWSQRFIAGR